MAKKKKGPGQPTKYIEDYARQAYIACVEGGFTDKKLAALFDVNPDTIYEWKKAHPEFAEQVQKGKDEFDSDSVETALLKISKGFRFTETTREARPIMMADAEGNLNEIGADLKVTKKVSKVVVPNAQAIRFWLRNRRRKRWPDTKDVKLGNEEGKPLGLYVAFPSEKDLSIADWEAQVKESNDIEVAENSGAGGDDGSNGAGS